MTIHINKHLKTLRHEMGLSQQAFADLLGISRARLGSYEEERAIAPLPVVAKTLEICQIPAEDLYDFIFDPNYLS